MGAERRGRAAARLVLLAVLAWAGCGRDGGPAPVALEYGRALYASDAAAMSRLISSEDRAARDEATLRSQAGGPEGFAREVLRQLASYVTAEPIATHIDGGRATVTLRFRLPDANAPAVASLVQDWDERALAAAPAGERDRIRRQLEELHRSGRLPVIEGDETFRLVREGGAWRIVVGWARGVRIAFGAALHGRPLEVTFSPAEVVAAPGDRVRVTIRARNVGDRPLTTRVGHRVEPAGQAGSLALLACPLFLPVTLHPGERQEFVSEYLVLKDVPADVRRFQVTYEF